MFQWSPTQPTMKYTIIINQLVLSKTKLDIIDAGILDYIGFLCGSTNPKVEKERITENDFRWTWVDLDTVFKEMPLLRLTSHSPISRRITKIVEEGYIDTIRKSNHRLYARLTPKHDELLLQSTSSQAQAGAVEHQSYSSTAHNKDNNNKEDSDKEAATPLSPNGEHKEKSAPTGSTANRLAEALWLKDISAEDVAYFKEKYPKLTEAEIRNQADSAYLWLEENPKKGRSGKKLFFKNWLDKRVEWKQQKKGGISFHEYK